MNSKIISKEKKHSSSQDLNNITQNKKYVYQVQESELNQAQNEIIIKILNELEKQPQKDFSLKLRQKKIRNILQNEFQLKEQEVQYIEQQILKQLSQIKHLTKVQEIQKSHSILQLSNNSKQQPLSILQRKELDHYYHLDFSQYPAKPCIQSLYYISKIAQTQQIKVIIPPTILIGFNDDNRLLYNCQKTGNLIVQTGFLSPKIISQFINQHLAPTQQSVEQKFIFPKYMIKFASKTSQQNEIKLYYSKNVLLSDVLSFWGTGDFAIQKFIKQKHIRPSIYRYYMKYGNVCKAVNISNQENLDKQTKLYSQMVSIIDEVQAQQLQTKPRAKSCKKIKRVDLKSSQQLTHSLTRKKSITNQSHLELPQEFPHSKLDNLYSQYHANVSQGELKRYFCVSSENIENLTMMNCRPGCQNSAEKMTQELYRFFATYYLQIKKFGNISQFICDFMEDENGLCYFLQIKSFECEGIKYDWQILKSPIRTQISPQVKQEKELLKEQEQIIKDSCEAKIICHLEQYYEIRELFEQVCKENNLWSFNLKIGTLFQISSKYVVKYKDEINEGKDNFILLYEKNKICPLFPLISFTENKLISARTKKLSNQLQSQNQQSYQDIPCCFHCYKILQLFMQRSMALVFKTEQTREELRKIKLKLYPNWNYENMNFLIKQYTESRKPFNIVSDLEKHQRNIKIRQLRERAKTPQSIMKKSFTNYTLLRQETLMKQEQQQREKTNQENSQFQLNNDLKESLDLQLIKNNEESKKRLTITKSKSINSARISRNGNLLLKRQTSQLAKNNQNQSISINNIMEKCNQSQHKIKQTIQTYSQRQFKQPQQLSINDKELSILMDKYTMKHSNISSRSKLKKPRRLIDLSELILNKNPITEQERFKSKQTSRNYVIKDDQIKSTIDLLNCSNQRSQNSNQVHEYFNMKRDIRQSNPKLGLTDNILCKTLFN